MKPKKLILNMGLEHERVIFDGPALRIAHVKGCPQARLPHDTMACLAETRGGYSPSQSEATELFMEEQTRVDKLFAYGGYYLEQGEHRIPRETAIECFEGDEKAAEERIFNLFRGGGLHIHFSLMHEGVCSAVMQRQLIINACCDALDKSMDEWIIGDSTYRQPGQMRRKPHGFEYRSLFWGGDIVVLRAMTRRAYQTVWCVLTDFHSTIRDIEHPTMELCKNPFALTGATL